MPPCSVKASGRNRVGKACDSTHFKRSPDWLMVMLIAREKSLSRFAGAGGGKLGEDNHRDAAFKCMCIFVVVVVLECTGFAARPCTCPFNVYI